MYEAVISNQKLMKEYLSESLKNYFYIKLKGEDENKVEIKICELLKFLCLSQHSFGNIPFDSRIDEVWHFWILQTVQYQELMEKLPGNKFIHHCSNDYKDPSEFNLSMEDELNNEFSYLVSYVDNFGGFSAEAVEFWPMANRLMEINKIDLNSLNKFLKEMSV